MGSERVREKAWESREREAGKGGKRLQKCIIKAEKRQRTGKIKRREWRK